MTGAIALLTLSWQTAYADWLANAGTFESLIKAVEVIPESAQYKLQLASREEFNGKVQPEEIRRQLREVLRLNPRSAEALLELGLSLESSGDLRTAEQLLLKAVEIDKTFKPVWTLANFYFRSGQIDKMWPQVAKTIRIAAKPGLGFFNLRAIYDLCWQTGEPSRINGFLLGRPDLQRDYFFYLLAYRHVTEAREIYPQALYAANPKLELDQSLFAMYDTLLFNSKYREEAAVVWNQLIDKHLIESSKLDPTHAIGIANSDFRLPLDPQPFGWVLPGKDKLVATLTTDGIRFEFNGRQQENVELLTKQIAVLPDRAYLLTWSALGERMNLASTDIGVSILLFDGDRLLPTQCSAFLAQESTKGCRFRSPVASNALKMLLVYQRRSGTIRLRGTLQVKKFSLSFASPTES